MGYLSPIVQSSSIPMTPLFTIANQDFKPEIENKITFAREVSKSSISTSTTNYSPIGITLSAIMTITAAPGSLLAAILPVLQAIT